MYLSAPLLHPPLTRQLPDFPRICRLQMQQLALQIPVLQAQVAHWDQSKSQQVKAQQITSLNEQSSESISQYSKYKKILIDSDDFLTQLSTLPLRVLTVVENNSVNAIASVCRFGQQCAEHQLRSPLALISLYAENLYLGLSADAQKQQMALIGTGSIG